MTYGTKNIQRDEGAVRCAQLEEAQRLQSGSPQASSLSSLKAPKSCHSLWIHGGTAWDDFLCPQKSSKGTPCREWLTISQAFIRNEINLEPQFCLSLSAACFWTGFPSGMLKLFTSCWCPSTQRNVSRPCIFLPVIRGFHMKLLWSGFYKYQRTVTEELFPVAHLPFVILLLVVFSDIRCSAYGAWSCVP